MAIAKSPQASLKDIYVLVVDDDYAAREYLRGILEHFEARVTTACSASEALSIIGELKPDVLLSDIGMPEIDGYELIRRLRRDGNRVPAVAVTAFSFPEDRRRALFCGYQTHLAKPASASELVSIVAALAARRAG